MEGVTHLTAILLVAMYVLPLSLVTFSLSFHNLVDSNSLSVVIVQEVAIKVVLSITFPLILQTEIDGENLFPLCFLNSRAINLVPLAALFLPTGREKGQRNRES